MEAGAIVCLATYAWIVICLLYPPQELISSGLTLDSLLKLFLEDERRSFVRHHFLRICCTLIIRICTLLGFSLFCIVEFYWGANDSTMMERLVRISSAYLLVGVICSSILWLLGPSIWHPLVRVLKAYDEDWRRVAVSVDEQYLQLDKFVAKLAGNVRLIITNSWIVVIEGCNVRLVKHEDAAMTVFNSNDRGTWEQLVSIRVESRRPGISPFTLRLNSRLLRDIRAKLSIPISIDSGVVVQSVEDRFLLAFKRVVEQNPKYDTSQWTSEVSCIGCFQAEASVKLVKTCIDDGQSNNGDDTDRRTCVTCNCRPMWCLTCMGRWFTSRQNPDHPELWLSGKCPCPSCRAIFCVLDVCLPEDYGGGQQSA